ncbi:metanephric macula densa development [Desmophyllum pertusum]|uniref:Metanephric macula densa development n=1 Tax=Desmophyllum pertusum TaxID=174260 RepID=A0A9W9ZAB8_9CNID|nr:metanephric macula densa development [Desmophyllum pertusum]
MCKLKPLLVKWLDDADNNKGVMSGIGKVEAQERKRKKRTAIEVTAKSVLENEFCKNHKPSAQEIGMLAENLGSIERLLECGSCNRRQKEKRLSAIVTGEELPEPDAGQMEQRSPANKQIDLMSISTCMYCFDHRIP